MLKTRFDDRSSLRCFIFRLYWFIMLARCLSPNLYHMMVLSKSCISFTPLLCGPAVPYAQPVSVHRSCFLAGKTGLKSLTCLTKPASVHAYAPHLPKCAHVFVWVCIFAAMHLCFISSRHARFVAGGSVQCCWYMAGHLCFVHEWYAFGIPFPYNFMALTQPYCRRCFMSTNRLAGRFDEERAMSRETD